MSDGRGSGDGDVREPVTPTTKRATAVDDRAGGGGVADGSAKDPTVSREAPHQGLMKLEEARASLGDPATTIDDIKELLKNARAMYLEIIGTSSEGETSSNVIAKGAAKAAAIGVACENLMPDSLELVRWFCSANMVSLKLVTVVMSNEARAMSDKRDALPAEYTRRKAVRLMRVLISAFNAFLTNARSRMFSTMEHVTLLDASVSWARDAMNRLGPECSSDPTVGKASARLRGLTVTACFTRLYAPADVQDATKFENVMRMGNRDVKKLLEAISRKSKKDEPSYLSIPGNCIESIGALRSIAVAAPHLYSTIAKAFADAVRCMDEKSIGKWGRRPALMDATVRVSEA